MCEDHDPVREVTCNILEDAGFQVLTTAHGKEALEVAEEYAQPIDLSISDVVMPEMNGLADRLRVLRPNIPVLFVSGHTFDIIDAHGIEGNGIESDDAKSDDVGFLQNRFLPSPSWLASPKSWHRDLILINLCRNVIYICETACFIA